MNQHLNKNTLLNESKVFCMMPWVHMHVWPSGDIFPCCISDSTKPVGNFHKDGSMKAVWNGEKMRELRKNMLEGKPSNECSRCYILDNQTQIHTLRTSSNNTYEHHWKVVEKTQANGAVSDVNMAYMDIRFSNLCNLRCHTCGFHLSSSWYEDQVKAFGKPDCEKNLHVNDPSSDRFWNELEPHLLNVESVYFAGGEPLITKEHYRVLDHWIKYNHIDIDLTYTTNFSQLGIPGYDVLGYWKKFKHVSIFASLDASWERAEYIRKGTRWQKIIDNRKKLLDECPNVIFEITPTISIYNVWHFPDFHLEWIEQGLIKVNDIRMNILTELACMSIQCLPRAFKETLVVRYKSAKEHLKKIALKKNEPFEKMENGYESVIEFMLKEDHEYRLKDFFERVEKVDAVRNENFFEVFPELVTLKKYKDKI